MAQAPSNLTEILALLKKKDQGLANIAYLALKNDFKNPSDSSKHIIFYDKTTQPYQA